MGAMWEAKLVVKTSKGEAVWETWEAKLVGEIWEAKEALCEAELVCKIWEAKGETV